MADAVSGLDEYDDDERGGRLDPIRAIDVILATAIRTRVEAIGIAHDDDGYHVTLERGMTVVATVTLDLFAGAAAVARLAFIANLDLAASGRTSGTVAVRSGEHVAEVVVTIRAGTQLGADLVFVNRRAAAPTPLVGRVGEEIGHYRLIAKLGQGGMGTVYSVEHTVLERRYALKVLRAKVFAQDRSAGARFVREARAAARVQHPNIAEVFDFGYVVDGRPYLVMELLTGRSLARHLGAEGPLPIRSVVAVARQLASALAAVHARGVVHADITASNVIVTNADPIEVKLIDFGLAALADDGVPAARSDVVLGTPAYISPEQLRGLRATDRSDQYQLGILLFELIAGHPPFRAEQVSELSDMHLTQLPPRPESPHGPVPELLLDIVATCLQKVPQQRFPGMRALLAALDDVERGVTRRGWQKWLAL